MIYMESRVEAKYIVYYAKLRDCYIYISKNISVIMITNSILQVPMPNYLGNTMLYIIRMGDKCCISL